MLCLIVSILFIPLCFIAGFFPPLICWILMAILWVISIALIIVSMILIFAHLYKKKSDIIGSLVSIVFFVLVLLYGSRAMVFVHSYNETRLELRKRYDQFEILDVYKKNIRDKENGHCDYVFNVKLKDSSDIIFHAGYCDVDISLPVYKVVDDWIVEYLPYYLEQYNESHNTNIRIEKIKKEFLDPLSYRIYVNPSNEVDVQEFLESIDKESQESVFRFLLIHEDTLEEEYYNSSVYY